MLQNLLSLEPLSDSESNKLLNQLRKEREQRAGAVVQQTSSMPVQDVPPEVWNLILEHVPLRSLFSLLCVSKFFKNTAVYTAIDNIDHDDAWPIIVGDRGYIIFRTSNGQIITIDTTGCVARSVKSVVTYEDFVSADKTIIDIKIRMGYGPRTSSGLCVVLGPTIFLIDKLAKLYGYGHNGAGQLGIGHCEPQKKPMTIPFFKDMKIKQVAQGEEHALVLTIDGQLYAMGRNYKGQLGQGGSLSSDTPVQVYFPALIDIAEIYASCTASFVLTLDGNVYAWGENSNGELGCSYPRELTSPTKVNPISHSNVSADIKIKKIIPVSADHSDKVKLTFFIATTGEAYVCGENLYITDSYGYGKEYKFECITLKDQKIIQMVHVSIEWSKHESMLILTESGEVHELNLLSFKTQKFNFSKTDPIISIESYYKGFVAISSKGDVYDYVAYGEAFISGQHYPIISPLMNVPKVHHAIVVAEQVFLILRTGKIWVRGNNEYEQFQPLSAGTSIPTFIPLDLSWYASPKNEETIHNGPSFSKGATY